jgi:hypothetical protein
VTNDFRDVLSEFEKAGVRFLVVGAHALAAHGVPRVTGDLDLWVEPTVENAHRVWQALAAFGAPLGSLGLRESDFAAPGQVVQLGLPPLRIDVLTSISGVDFAEAWQERVDGVLFDVPVAFLGRVSFIANKRASARPRDRFDLEALGEDPGG